MNLFEKQINALRLQYKAERVRIQKDANRRIGRLNTAIGRIGIVEAREALRAEKARVYEATRDAMKVNRLCYLQQLEALEDQYGRHLQTNPSNRQLRRLMGSLCREAEARGESSITLRLSDSRTCTVAFS